MTQEDIDKLFGPTKRQPIRIISVSESTPIPDDPDSVASRLLAKPRLIHFFTDGPDPAFDPKAYSDYLQRTLGPNFTIESHGDLTSYLISKDPAKRTNIAAAFAEASFVTNSSGYGLSKPLSKEEKEKLEEDWINHEPKTSFRGFAEYKALVAREQSMGRTRLAHNDYYDLSKLGMELHRIIPQELVGIHDDTQNSVLIVTGRGIANDERGRLGQSIIHMLGGFTSAAIAVVSTTGLVEAPGKPKEVEEALKDGVLWSNDPQMSRRFKDAVEKAGSLNHEILKRILHELFMDRMLNYEDPRMTEVAKGLGLSMILFTMGEHGRAAQCSTTDLARAEPDLSKTCRMHDAHWQEELIATQIKEPSQSEFCDYHTEIFKRLEKSA